MSQSQSQSQSQSRVQSRFPHFYSFQVFNVALELVRSLREVIDAVAKQDGDMAKQLRRARTSVPLNIREGNRRHGKDRRYLWSVAAGSADEIVGCLLTAEAAGYLTMDAIIPSLELADRVLAMLHQLTR